MPKSCVVSLVVLSGGSVDPSPLCVYATPDLILACSIAPLLPLPPYGTVDGGQAAVMFDRFRGVLPVAVGEGTHFLIPFIQNPTVYDIRTRPRSITSVTGTKDLQQVNLTLRVLCRPDVDKLSTIHMNLGPDYDERVLPSIGNEVGLVTAAQFRDYFALSPV